MGCIPSKKSMDVPPKPDMSIVARTMTRGSSVEQMSERPRSLTSVDTKVEADHPFPLNSGGAPIPPRVDCIAPRPRVSEESLRRRKHDESQAHQESSTTATATSVAAGAAVHTDNGASVGASSDAGGGASGGDGGGGE